jgi:hypothetical protein
LTRSIALLLTVAILLGVAVIGEYTARIRAARARVSALLEGDARLVDMGIVVRVVRRDEAHGAELLQGKPRLTVLREHRFGGVVDTLARPHRFVGPSVAPVTWYASERAEELLLHESCPDRVLVYGAMGAGKTTTMVQWTGIRASELTGIGGEIGMTAPTNDRSVMIEQAVRDLFPRAWYRWRERSRTFALANGVTLRLVSTHQQSRAEGSRVQGFNWVRVASDEIQDSIHADGDIEARGRDAPGGRFLRFNTATAKDDSEWRTWRDRVLSSRRSDGTFVWGERRMSGPESPFTHPQYWNDLALTLTPREYERKVLALDVGPERMVYPTYSRADNVRPIPQIGAVDCTATVLRPYTGARRASVLIGHDPGSLHDVSVVLKAYRLQGEPLHAWFVVDELTTTQSTTEAHVRLLVKRLRERWGVHMLDWSGKPDPDAEIALVRADPYGNNDARPDRGVYATFRNHGLDIRPAAYKLGSDKPAQIQKSARIDMVSRLLCDATGRRRLFFACDDRRVPLAPRTVEAIERSELDAAGEAETQRKDANDLSHWPCALGYALHSLERVRFGDRTEAVS